MESKEIIKFLKEFDKKFKPVPPLVYSPEQLAVRLKIEAWLKIEQERQKEYEWMHKLKGKKLLEGIAASSGIAVGTVRNVQEQNPRLIAKIKQGEIVVADKLKVDLVALYVKKVAAFVTNTGGRSANGAIIAREYKIPLVTGTKSEGEDATLILKTGQKVVVDGTEGAVYECIKTKSAIFRKG